LLEAKAQIARLELELEAKNKAKLEIPKAKTPSVTTEEESMSTPVAIQKKISQLNAN